MKKIIFVCKGNIHRSVIAEAVFRKILKKQNLTNEIAVSSYGIQGTMGTRPPKGMQLSDYPREWQISQPILQKFNIDITKHYFQTIAKGVIEDVDLVIAMDDEVHKESKNALVKQFPAYMDKIYCFYKFTDGKSIKDLSGNVDPSSHEQVIKYIYQTLHTKFLNILKLL